MFLVFEISRPFQKKPGIWHKRRGVWRAWWLWFALAVHRENYHDWLLDWERGRYEWSEK